MSSDVQTVFLVDGYSDPAILKINGRASYTNCAPVGTFFNQMVKNKKENIVVDFADCTGMDSTFLGILAGAALQSKKMDPPSFITLCRLGTRNLELVRNLGLHRILRVDSGDFDMTFDDKGDAGLNTLDRTEIANAKTILKAHEDLVAADAGNLKKFQDVLAYLKVQVDKEEWKSISIEGMTETLLIMWMHWVIQC